ncbi:MAG: tRNA (adenosine(37)-N6)-threonylcarbamoyltransferase complex dimerization subunit type 1 TsaB [Pyrinomonadaceae bacterium]
MSIIHSSELILGIDSATRGGSVALARGDEILGALEGDPTGTQSTQALGQIREILDANGLTLVDVDRIAVTIGPGSFTGLRIGIATAKGLAATLGCAVAAVPTLYAVARSAGVPGSIVALIPAGRNEVFAQRLRVNVDGAIEELTPPDHLPLPQLIELCGGIESLTWASVAGANYTDAVMAAGFSNWHVTPPTVNLAVNVIQVAQAGGRESTPTDLTAMYVRLSDAELKLRCQP